MPAVLNLTGVMAAEMLRVLTLSSLFPDATRPNFGVFVERQTLGLTMRDGVEVRVVAPIGLPPLGLSRWTRHHVLAALPLAETWKGLAINRPRFTAWPASGGRAHAASLTRALVPVLDRVRRSFAFDVIDAEFAFPDGVAAVALGRRYGVPVSIKARGSDVHHWGRARTTARQVREAACAADGLLAVSAAMRDDMIALGMPGERIRIHHTGVDQARFAPRARVAGKAVHGVSGPLVVASGALIALKGHDVVIEAVAKLPGVHLLIAGDGPERGALQALIDRLGVGARIRLLGAVPHGAMPELIAAADVMALASEREGLANAWIEALASGTPVVIPDAGGAREVVTTAAAGRIVARTPDAFAGAIAELLAEPPVPGAVRASVAEFTWERNAASLEAHLRSLLV